MEAARQRVRAAVARKKEEEKRAKGKEGASSLAPKAVSKSLAKRKVDGKDDHPPKKAVVTPRDAHLKKKSPSSQVAARVEGPCHLLTHKDYAIEEVESLIKLTDMKPCVELGTEELEASALFDLTRVSLPF